MQRFQEEVAGCAGGSGGRNLEKEVIDIPTRIVAGQVIGLAWHWKNGNLADDRKACSHQNDLAEWRAGSCGGGSGPASGQCDFIFRKEFSYSRI